jgi:hypothetical protein
MARNLTEASDRPGDRSEYDVDALAPARGIALGVVLGAAMWCGIGLSIWLLF